MDLLIKDARRAEYAFYNKATDECMLVPIEHLNAPQLAQFIDAGAELIAVVALMRKAPEGKPSVQYELAPGVTEETGQKIKQMFSDRLLADGTLELSRFVN